MSQDYRSNFVCCALDIRTRYILERLVTIPSPLTIEILHLDVSLDCRTLSHNPTLLSSIFLSRDCYVRRYRKLGLAEVVHEEYLPRMVPVHISKTDPRDSWA